MAAGGVDVTFLRRRTYLLQLVARYYQHLKIYGKIFPASCRTIMVHILATIALCVALLALFRIASSLFSWQRRISYFRAPLSMVLLPFGVTRWTSSICEKTWGSLLSLVLLS